MHNKRRREPRGWQRLPAALIIVMLMCVLGACGQKGGLYLPDDQQPGVELDEPDED